MSTWTYPCTRENGERILLESGRDYYWKRSKGWQWDGRGIQRNARAPLDAHPQLGHRQSARYCQSRGKAIMTDEQIKYMVDRFLGWRLPEHFRPDAGISFNPEYNVEYSKSRGLTPPRHNPIGTNLFDREQAEAMVRYMIEGMPAGLAVSPDGTQEGRWVQGFPDDGTGDAK